TSLCPLMIEYLTDSQNQVTQKMEVLGKRNELLERNNHELESKCGSYLLKISNLEKDLQNSKLEKENLESSEKFNMNVLN
ncbi:hypothetical protein ABFV55_27895, partial [Pseudomonas syringae]|uniref:hypothetical protein n=1 Tax=Pseudomonas syringae TaxID=317 RepID=UPI0034D95BBD